MSQDNVIELKRPESFIDDPITDILRNGARRLLEQVLKIEIDSFLHQNGRLWDDPGRKTIIYNGYLTERKVQKG